MLTGSAWLVATLAALQAVAQVAAAANNATHPPFLPHSAAARSHAHEPLEPATGSGHGEQNYSTSFWMLFTVLPVALLAIVVVLLVGISYARRRSHRTVVYRPRLKAEDVHLQDTEALEYDPMGMQLHDSMHSPCVSVCLEDRDGSPLALWRAVSLSSIQVQPAFEHELLAFEWELDLPTSDHPSREARSASF